MQRSGGSGKVGCMCVQLEGVGVLGVGRVEHALGQWYFTFILHANVGSWVTHSEVGASSADVAPR